MPNSTAGLCAAFSTIFGRLNSPSRVLVEQHQQRVLHERQTRRRLEVAARLLLERVRRMIGRDDVDAIARPRPRATQHGRRRS